MTTRILALLTALAFASLTACATKTSAHSQGASASSCTDGCCSASAKKQ
jgi:hypothetical protein